MSWIAGFAEQTGAFMIEPSAWFWMPILLGPFVGSCLGLVSLRWPAGKPIVAARSACDGCERRLSPWSLVPIASFIVQRGRCGCCSTRIPLRYPLLEAACLGLGVAASLRFEADPMALLTAVLSWWLLLIAVLDAKHMWLPDALTVPLLIAGLVASLVVAPDSLGTSILGAVCGFASLWVLSHCYLRWRGRQGLGDGDPIFLCAIGAWIGYAELPWVVLIASGSG